MSCRCHGNREKKGSEIVANITQQSAICKEPFSEKQKVFATRDDDANCGLN